MNDNRKHQYTPPGTVAITWSRVGNIVNSRGIKTKHLRPTPTQYFGTVTQKDRQKVKVKRRDTVLCIVKEENEEEKEKEEHTSWQ